MSIAIERYQQWLADPLIDSSTKQELEQISQQTAEIEDRFYRDLEFGTGGLRGVIGAGTNRLNVYTVGKATQGFARFLLEQAATVEGISSVVIAYDSRFQSPEFAEEAALVLAGNGIKAYVFESLRATPELSYAVRHLKATGGIVVTASHNPPEYNGYKVYGTDGGQLVPDQAEAVIGYIQEVDSLSAIRRISRAEAEQAGLLVWIGEAIDRAFIDVVTATTPGGEEIAEAVKDLKVVYTPLHGAGNLAVRAALKQAGFTQVMVVPEQEQPDSQFSTVASPNPEERAAFTLAIQLAEQLEADIIIGTDPDCDRMGAVVRNNQGEYTVLTGNQSGAIMVHYVLSRLKQQGKLPKDGIVIKTIVTSEMGAVIAKHYGMQVLSTLTGFKYIGEKMTEYEQAGTPKFLFGYEESYGYLAGTYARDKDAVLASLLICEAAAYYKQHNQSLYDVLQELYEQHGYYLERLESRTLKGKDGMEQIQSIMNEWREHPPTVVAGVAVDELLDYSRGIDELPAENVLKFKLADGAWFCLRPSGTEPKIKLYFAVCGSSQQQSLDAMEQLTQAVLSRL
ncbi:MAG: phospho-sugar mutase [Paenibacillaceae bacterium]